MSYTIPGYPNGASVVEALNRAMAVSNLNLLINGDFRNPVNPQGQTSYSAPGYTIARWVISDDGSFTNITLGAGGLTFVCSGMRYWGQRKEGSDPAGKIYTVSIELGGIIHALTMAFPATPGSQTTYTPVGASGILCSFQFAASGTYMRVMFGFPAGTYSNLAWAKLEPGSVATPFVPRPFSEELALCQRYFYKYSGRPLAIINGESKTAAFTQINFPQIMRLAPTVTVISLPQYQAHGTYKVPTSADSLGATDRDIQFVLSFSSAWTVEGGLWAVGTLEIDFDAEIY